MIRLMLEALGGARQTAPSGRAVMLSASFGRSASRTVVGSRSAITPWTTAPGLAPTGRVSLGREDPRHYARLGSALPNRHSGRTACRGLEAGGRLLSDQVAHTPHRRPRSKRVRAAASSCLPVRCVTAPLGQGVQTPSARRPNARGFSTSAVENDVARVDNGTLNGGHHAS